MIRKIIFSLFGLFLLIIGINNEIIKQRNSKASLPKKANEEKPERVSSSKMEKKKPTISTMYVIIRNATTK